MRQIVRTTGFVLATLLLTFPVLAQPDGPASQDPLPQDRPGGKGFQELVTRLGLTPEQETTLKGIRQEFLNQTADKRDALHMERQELSTLFRDPKAKDADIIAKKKEVTALRDQIGQKAMEYRLKARKVLTPEQIEKLPSGCGLGIGPGMCRWRGQGMGRGMGPKGPPRP